MAFFSTRSLFKRTRRPFEGCLLTSCLVIIFIALIRWTLSPTQPHRPREKGHENPYLPQEKARPNVNFPPPPEPMDQLDHGRPELGKYIHLDLKGAPPKAAPFYDSFFNFMSKLQMGVKGVLIEYEDTLPLQGNLANVSTSNNEIRLEASGEKLDVISLGHSSRSVYQIRDWGDSNSRQNPSDGNHSTHSDIRPFRMVIETTWIWILSRQSDLADDYFAVHRRNLCVTRRYWAQCHCLGAKQPRSSLLG